MYSGDQGESYSEPWTYRKRIAPLRTYCGEVKYKRKKHYFNMKDAARITSHLQDPLPEKLKKWLMDAIGYIRQIIDNLLEKVMFYIAPEEADGWFELLIHIIRSFFEKILTGEFQRRYWGESVINTVAWICNINVTINRK